MLKIMPSRAIKVIPVRSRAAHRTFCRIPYLLYRDDPCWVPPLRSEERRRWSATHNPSLRTRWVRRYVAERDSRPLGRIAAIMDPGFADRWEPRAGFFGFFESVDDPEVWGSLLSAAENDLRSADMTRVIGPVNLTTHDEVGLLVDGFDSPPMILCPYNPPRYASHLEADGYRQRTDYYSYRWTSAVPRAPAVRRIVRRLRRAGFGVRPSDPGRWQADLRLLHSLYNESFTDVWGFVPLGWDELVARANSFRRFYRPELALFAQYRGRAVGFALALPDINQILRKLDGRLWPFGWLRLVWDLRKLRSARFILLGVLPRFRHRGIGVLLAAEMAAGGERIGIDHAELSLVLASNEKVRAVIEAHGGEAKKTYRLYEKRLER